MSPLFAKRMTGTGSPLGSVTLSRRSANHWNELITLLRKLFRNCQGTFSIELKVSGLVKSKTIAAATLKLF